MQPPTAKEPGRVDFTTTKRRRRRRSSFLMSAQRKIKGQSLPNLPFLSSLGHPQIEWRRRKRSLLKRSKSQIMLDSISSEPPLTQKGRERERKRKQTSKRSTVGTARTFVNGTFRFAGLRAQRQQQQVEAAHKDRDARLWSKRAKKKKNLPSPRKQKPKQSKHTFLPPFLSQAEGRNGDCLARFLSFVSLFFFFSSSSWNLFLDPNSERGGERERERDGFSGIRIARKDANTGGRRKEKKIKPPNKQYLFLLWLEEQEAQ